MELKRIFEDDRPIDAIYFPDEGCYRSGENGVEKIIAYQESGDMAFVTWFAIYRDGKIDQRVNAAYISIVCY